MRYLISIFFMLTALMMKAKNLRKVFPMKTLRSAKLEATPVTGIFTLLHN